MLETSTLAAITAPATFLAFLMPNMSGDAWPSPLTIRDASFRRMARIAML